MWLLLPRDKPSALVSVVPAEDIFLKIFNVCLNSILCLKRLDKSICLISFLQNIRLLSSDPGLIKTNVDFAIHFSRNRTGIFFCFNYMSTPSRPDDRERPQAEARCESHCSSRTYGERGTPALFKKA